MMHNTDFLKRMGHRLAGEDGRFDRDAVQALACLAVTMDLTDRLLECLPGPTPIILRIRKFPDDRKIAAIKAVRTVLQFGLKDAKEFVEGKSIHELTAEQRDQLEADGIIFEEVQENA